MTQQKKIKVALVGYGHLGRWHAQKIDALKEEGAVLTAIVDPSSSQQAKAKEAHPHARIVSSLKDIIDEVDAVSIVSPTTYHFESIALCAEKEKHILCEKPLCASKEEVLAIEKLLEKKASHLVWQVGHSERFHQAWEILSSKEGLLSEKSSLWHLNRMAPFHPRAKDVDVVSDLMIHDIDLMNFLTKEIPSRVWASGHKIRSQKWDAVTADFSFSSGRRVVIRSHRDFVKPIRDFEVTTSHATHYVDLASNEIMFTMSNGVDVAVEKMSYEKRDHLFLENRHFITSIRDGKAPVISFAEGLLACKIAFAVLNSVAENRSVEI